MFWLGKGNQGLGGYQDYGCLRYGFYPNNIPGLYGTPPHPELYFDLNNPKNIYHGVVGK